MHICFIEDTQLHGGTQIWVSEAIRDFTAKGHEVTLLTAAGGFNAADGEETDAHVFTYDYDDVVERERRHRDIWTAALASADVAVCTVHPPRQGFHCSRFAAECIAEAGLATILQPKTGTIVPEYLAEYYAPPEPINYHVIAITDFTRRYLVDSYGIDPDHVSLVYQGTDVATFTADPERARRARDRYPLPPDAFPVLGSIGSFEHRKGQVELLHALDRSRAQLPNAHLMLVGDGPDEEILRATATTLDLDDMVTFFPFTREPAEVFEIVDVLVLSSLFKEGLPNVLLEAMSMGLPVISSRLAGTPEVVIEGETGLLVEPGDVAALADAIMALGLDPDRSAAMGRAGRRLMERDFDKVHQFDAFLEHFASLGGSSGSNS